MSATALSVNRANDIQPVLVPRTFDQLVTFADLAAASELVPKDYRNKPANVMIAVQMGSELGLSPMQSLQSIAVINGRPGVWGDGLIGLCRQSPLCEDIIETFEGAGESLTAVCVAIRRGKQPVTSRFSVADAKRAGLWGKDVWAKYPDRMLQNRARGYALRDAFPDVLRGLKTVEELRDIPPDSYRGVTLDAAAESTSGQQPPAARSTPGQAAPSPSPAAAEGTAKRRTAREWLDDLRASLAACADEDAVHAIAGSATVRQALEWLKDAGKEEVHAMLAEAIERVHKPAEEAKPEPEMEPADEDVFPGDR